MQDEGKKTDFRAFAVLCLTDTVGEEAYPDSIGADPATWRAAIRYVLGTDEHETPDPSMDVHREENVVAGFTSGHYCRPSRFQKTGLAMC